MAAASSLTCGHAVSVLYDVHQVPDPFTLDWEVFMEALMYMGLMHSMFFLPSTILRPLATLAGSAQGHPQ